MIDLRTCYSEASNNILTWRNRYSSNEYPHKIVLNMMYRAYTMETIWSHYKTGLLPFFSDTYEALRWMEQYYGRVATEDTHSKLLSNITNEPHRGVGTITFSKYDTLAKHAESNKSKLEELEFSYIFNLLQDKCVLYYIGFRQMDKSFDDSIGTMTDKLIEEIPNIDYEVIKYVFQQLLVAEYMNTHYNPLP